MSRFWSQKKKGKKSLVLTDRINELANKFDENKAAKEVTVEVMLAHLKKESEDNFICLKTLLDENTKALTSSITFKAFMGSDVTGQTAPFQHRIGRNITRVVEHDFFDPAYNSTSDVENN